MRPAVPAAESYRLFGHTGPYKDCMGIYHEHFRESRGKKTLRSVFRHENLPVYLYFHTKDKTWALSNTIGSAKCWLFTADQARKPHLIVSSWRYIDPGEKKWKTELKMKCEPRMSDSSSEGKSLSSLKIQANAMTSVLDALKEENAELRRILSGSDNKKINELMELKVKKMDLMKRLESLQERTAKLGELKIECDKMNESKKALEKRSRDLMGEIVKQEKLLKDIEEEEEHVRRNNALEQERFIEDDPPDEDDDLDIKNSLTKEAEMCKEIRLKEKVGLEEGAGRSANSLELGSGEEDIDWVKKKTEEETEVGGGKVQSDGKDDDEKKPQENGNDAPPPVESIKGTGTENDFEFSVPPPKLGEVLDTVPKGNSQRAKNSGEGSSTTGGFRSKAVNREEDAPVDEEQRRKMLEQREEEANKVTENMIDDALGLLDSFADEDSNSRRRRGSVMSSISDV